jgi:hypothetical protein
MEKYSNLSQQGERIQEVLEIVPTGHSGPSSRTPRRFRRALEPDEITALVEAYQLGTPIKDLTVQFQINRNTLMEHLAVQDKLSPDQWCTTL